MALVWGVVLDGEERVAVLGIRLVVVKIVEKAEVVDVVVGVGVN